MQQRVLQFLVAIALFIGINIFLYRTLSTSEEHESYDYLSEFEVEWMTPIPAETPENQIWRYSSKNLYWTKNDTLFRKFQKYSKTITKFPPDAVSKECDRICDILREKNRTTLSTIFENCYKDTLKTTVDLLEDGTTYIITGDIPLMWLRDSTNQLLHYLPLTANDAQIQIIFEGFFRK